MWDWDRVGKSDWMGCVDFSIDDMFAEVLRDAPSNQWSALYNFITNDVRLFLIFSVDHSLESFLSLHYFVTELLPSLPSYFQITFNRTLGTRLKFKGEKVSGSISVRPCE